MAVLTTATGLVSAGGSALGFDPVKELGGLVKGIFGSKPDPNKGQASLIDALDNYERISAQQANIIKDDIIRALSAGSSDRDIARLISQKTGYTLAQVEDSYKWPILTPFLGQIRSQISQQTGGQQASQPTGQQSGMGNNTIILLALAVGGFLILRG